MGEVVLLGFGAVGVLEMLGARRALLKLADASARPADLREDEWQRLRREADLRARRHWRGGAVLVAVSAIAIVTVRFLLS